MSPSSSVPAPPSPPHGVSSASLVPVAHRFLQLVGSEESDTPARIAMGASALASVFSLGNYLIGPNFLGVFPYLVTRSLLYGSTLLAGTIIASGFLSRAKSARFAAVVATSSIVAFYLGRQVGMTAPLYHTLSVTYGVALIGGMVTWCLRSLRRRWGAGAG